MDESFNDIELYKADSIIHDIDSFMLLLNEKNKDSVIFTHVGLVNRYSCFTSKYKKYQMSKDGLKDGLEKNRIQLTSLKKDIIDGRLGWYADSLKMSLDSTIVQSLKTEELYFKLYQNKFNKRVKSVMFCHSQYYSDKDSLWTLFNKEI